MQTARLKMQIRNPDINKTIKNSFAGRYPRQSRLINAEKENSSWELKQDNVGVYAIQGRRPHMEDRFNVVSDHDNSGTSVFGVFDGHGGEVRKRICFRYVVLYNC